MVGTNDQRDSISIQWNSKGLKVLKVFVNALNGSSLIVSVCRMKVLSLVSTQPLKAELGESWMVDMHEAVRGFMAWTSIARCGERRIHPGPIKGSS